MMEGRARTIISGAGIVTPHGVIADGVLSFAGEDIDFVGTPAEFAKSPLSSEPACRIEAGGAYVLPGFVDIHVHGGFGGDFMDADASIYDRITTYHASHGTTSILATTVTATRDDINKVLKASADYRSGRRPGAKLAGVHLEGPFINLKWSGAQNPAHIVPPRTDWLEEWASAYPGLIKIVTLAPEQEQAFEAIAWLTRNGIVASAGHTDATFEQMQTAAGLGLRHAVHTFNAMRGIHHREPGTAGAVMGDDRIVAEVIADGHHVHPACIRMLARAKGPDGLVLITDAISASGLGSGSYQLGGLEVTMADGVARLTQGGALAGSTLTMIEAFRYSVEEVGLSMADASRAASGNPARVIGIDHITGSLVAGKRADVLLISPDWKVSRVWVEGREVQGVE
jgi:N-acetylglucosamine-6-phosphate deacetylase